MKYPGIFVHAVVFNQVDALSHLTGLLGTTFGKEL